MHQEGHVGLNLVLFAPAAYWLAAQDEMLLMGVAMIGVVSMAPIPDIDLTLPIRHRGPTHSIWFATLIGIVYASLLLYSGVGDLAVVETAVVGFSSGFVGVIGHILGDMITPMGVAPLEPVSSLYIGLGLCSSGNKRVNRGLLQAGAYAFVGAIILATVNISNLLEPITRLI